MKILILLLLAFFSTNDNKFSEVIVTPKALLFKHENGEKWTVQTLSRNYQIYDLFTIKGLTDSIVEKDNIPFKYYSDTITEFQVSSWTSNIFVDTVNILDLPNYKNERSLGLREKVSMVAYLNRKEFPLIENFFSKTFVVGNQSISTSLDKPMNIIDYEDGKYLFYHDRNNIICLTKSGKQSFSKDNFTWKYDQKKLFLYPNENYVKTKPISAIKKGRSWYNNNWEKMRKEGKLYAQYDPSGIKWNRSGLTENELNLLAWFLKS